MELPVSASTPHPAFECLRTVHIPSLNIDMSEYRHLKTGASHFHLAADNPENVFLVPNVFLRVTRSF